MAYINSHVKVTIFGDCLNGSEEWSTGFHMGSAAEGSGNFGVDADWVNSLAAAWETYFTNTQNGFATVYRTLGVKAGIVKEDTKYDLSTIVTRTYATPIVGTSGGGWFPPQCSLVASLETANRRELGGKGRMYLPGINFPINNTGQLSPTENQRIATNFAAFLDAVEVAAGSPGYVMIASQGRKSADGTQTAPPVNRRVTNVRVGSVYDTQRRRRNQLSETYFNATLTADPQ